MHVIVTDEKNEPVQNITAVLVQLPDSVLIFKKTFNGEFFLDVNANTRYVLNMSAARMQDFIKAFFINDTAITIKAVMANKVSNMETVTIVAKKPLIIQEDDKTIVDAEPLANSSTNAYEVLEKTPGIITDQDGNVYLSSTNTATVYINGREMKISSADLASLLKSLPAGSVSKIEILRTPSAKFDAASSGGIVNIVLKKGIKLGTNGSFNAGYFQGVYSTKTAGININKGSGKFNSYFSYQFTERNNFEEINSERFISRDSSKLSQQSFTTYPGTNNYISAGIDIAFSTKLNFGYDLRISNNSGKSDALNNIDINNIYSQALLARNASDIDNKNNTLFIGSNVSAKYKIDTIGSEWNTQFDYNYYRNRNLQDYQNLSYLPSRSPVLGDGANNNNKNFIVFKTDLTLKLPRKYTLETGFKTSISNSNNSATYFKDTGNNVKFVDAFQTNSFRYKENISAAYLQVSKSFFGFIIKPGIRLESTDINGRQLIPKDTTFSIKRTDVFPYLFISHKLFKLFGFPLIGNAIYRKSIKRPYYEVLNPFPRYVDQYLFDVGNPGLKPQFTTNYELNVSFNDIPVLAFGINDTKDIFSNVTYQDNVTKVAYRTFDNLGKNKEYYFRAIGGKPPGGKYFFYVGAQHNFNRYSGFYQGLPLEYNRGSWVFFMFQELKATKTLSVNMQGFIRTKGLQNLYELNTMGGLFVSVNKSILKKKANIIVSVSDVFRTNRVGFRLQQGTVNAQGTRVNDTRKAGITIRYNFGFKPKEKEDKKKMFETPVEIN